MTSAPELTSRELQVARLLVTGLTQKEVGVRLGIARSTVKRHCTNVYRKIGARPFEFNIPKLHEWLFRKGYIRCYCGRIINKRGGER